MIDVEVTGPRDATYSEFLEQLQKYKNECRYCVFDFPANIPVESGGQEKSSMSVDRLVLMTWYDWIVACAFKFNLFSINQFSYSLRERSNIM